VILPRLFLKKENLSFYDWLRNLKKHKNYQEEIGLAGINFFLLLYGANETDDLSTLRLNNYMKLAAGSNKLIPAKLSPTTRAARFHSQRVYLQVMQWIKLMDIRTNPLEWGWKLINGKMVPVMTVCTYKHS